MKNLYKISLKIAKEIFAAIILKDENAFKKYLEDHPNYREDTVFIVDGVKRIAPSKKKKSKELTKKELKEVDNTLNGVFRALEEKGTDLEKLTPEKMQILHNIVNGVLEKSGISKLTEKQFTEMFNKKKTEKYGKREEPKKEEKKEDPKNPQLSGWQIRQKTNEIVSSVISNEEIARKVYEEQKAEDEKKLEEKKEKLKLNGRSLEEKFEEYKSIFGEKSYEDFLREELGFKALVSSFEEFMQNYDSIFIPNYFSLKNREIVCKLVPDFKSSFEEVNKNLKQQNLPEISEDDFRKIYNDTKFPYIRADFYNGASKEEIEDFCKEFISKNFYSSSPTATFKTSCFINGIQKIKREFPDLYKAKMGEFGVGLETIGHVENRENAAACVFGDGRGINIYDSAFKRNRDGIYSQYKKNGNVFEQGEVFCGRTGVNHSTKERIEIIAVHEMGHMTKYMFHAYKGEVWDVVKDPGKFDENGKQKYKTKYFSEKSQQLEKKIEDLYEESWKNGDIFKLSWYASTEPEEFWAEIFSMYYYDKSILPSNILTKLEEIINDIKS